MTERIDQAIEKAIVRKWKTSRYSTGALADEFDLSQTTVRRVLERNGISDWQAETRRKRRFTTPAQDEEIVRRYVAGESAQNLAAEFGLRFHVSVTQRVRAAGHAVRPAGPRFIDATPEQMSEILRLRDEGWSQERIADAIGISQTRVSRYLIQAGRRAWPLGRHPGYTDAPVKLSSGYLGVRVPEDDPLHVMTTRSGYIPQHRYVMASALGRPLTRSETVHHINGDRHDNRLENLQLRQGLHGTGVVFTCADCGSHRVAATPLA